MNGKRSLREVAQCSEVNSGSSAASLRWLTHWAGRVQSAGLICSSNDGDVGPRLWSTIERRRRSANWLRLLNPLSIRIRLFDPTRLLAWLSPLSKLLFSKVVAVGLCLLLPLIIYLVTIEVLPIMSWAWLSSTIQELNAQRLGSLLVIFILMKAAHELGHALACRKWNVECHEIGLLLMALIPCLYCDTSDSWKLNKPRQRACIAAAGIYVELLLSVLAACVWLITKPDSWIHLASAYTMVIGAMGTVFVNMNPLLKYDGYYVLSDLWRVPNLAEQSSEALRVVLARLLTGQKLPKEQWDSSPWTLSFYAVAAVIFRLITLFGILMFIWIVLDRMGLRLVGAAVLAMTCSAFVAMLVIRCIKTVGSLVTVPIGRILRAIIVLTLLSGAGWYLLHRPWPVYVSARAVCRYSTMTPIYAMQTGELLSDGAFARPVRLGEPLVQLKSTELEMQQLELRGQVLALEQKLAQIKMSLVDDVRLASELGNTVAELAKLRSQLQIVETEMSQLTVYANHSGVLIPSDLQLGKSLSEKPDADRWVPILSQENLGCTIQQGMLLGWLVKPESVELRAVIPESEAEFLKPGMPVICRWDNQSSMGAQGEISRVAPEPLEKLPNALHGDPDTRVTVNALGHSASPSQMYEAYIMIPELPVGALHQSLATVHIFVGQRSLRDMLHRYYVLNIRPHLVNQNR